MRLIITICLISLAAETVVTRQPGGVPEIAGRLSGG